MFKLLQQKLSKSNLRRTLQYCRKNGICNTFYAVQERMSEKGKVAYKFIPSSVTELEKQRGESREWNFCRFSIIVPAYETKEEYLQEMLDSVLAQSYENWELIIADASSSDIVEKVMKGYADERICYVKIKENKGISHNSNEALAYVNGEYTALLDHDDILTPNALYELAFSIREAFKEEKETVLIYSDEDKTDGSASIFFEPHQKEDFNLDLFLSNNYICHFTAIRSDILKELKFRPEFDGAQDYDLFLRVVTFLGKEADDKILHVPKVLYHWRCHEASTAENPLSKMYAYEAGRKALEQFCIQRKWKVQITHTKHLGFYRICYQNPLFEERSDIAAIGGPVFEKGKIIGGALNHDGKILYQGLKKHFSGYMHKASLQQQVHALNPFRMTVRKECKKILQDVLKLYGWDEASNKRDKGKTIAIGEEFAKRVRKDGYVLYYDPYYDKEGRY